MPSRPAAASAVCKSLEAMACTSDHSPRCIAGMTFSVPIFAVLNTPHVTFFISRHLNPRLFVFKFQRNDRIELVNGALRNGLDQNAAVHLCDFGSAAVFEKLCRLDARLQREPQSIRLVPI